VKPGTYDPAKTYLVSSGWQAGIGCPTNADTSSNGAKKPDGTYTDPACPTGDSKDTKNEACCSRRPARPVTTRPPRLN
jgi:hypothetical protein